MDWTDMGCSCTKIADVLSKKKYIHDVATVVVSVLCIGLSIYYRIWEKKIKRMKW